MAGRTNLSQDLDWSAGSYNPSELEKWKQKIYGSEFYNDDDMATTPIWNQNRSASSDGGSDNGRNNRPKRNKKRNKEDRYFRDNIAAITESWSDEDNGGFNYTQRIKECYDKYLRKQKNLLYIIAIALFATIIATAAVFKMVRSDSYAPTNQLQETNNSLFQTNADNEIYSSNNKEVDLPERDAKNTNGLFETRTTQLFVQEGGHLRQRRV